MGRPGELHPSFAQLNREARLAGLFYILTIVAGLFAEVYVRGSLRVAGDPAATAANLLAAPGFLQLGLFADLVMLASYVIVTVLLYRVFRVSNSALSAVAAGLSLIGIALLAANTGLLSAVPLLLEDGRPVAAIEIAQRQEVAHGLLRLHSAIYSASGLFFGLYCLAIGTLIIVSRLTPRLVGVLMAMAGTMFLADSALDLLAPAVSRQIPDVVMAISLLGEGALALWLAIAGVSRAGLSRTE